jgi:ferrous iron transport protein B
VVAIVGPPNSGKSTLFNRLTGLRQKVANFPGVTVEHHMGRVKLERGREVYVVDLPGVYSLTPRTEDERVTHDVLAGSMKGLAKPDAVMLILDSTNLSRHLSLAAPILSLGLPTLVILNMADDLHGRGGEVDAKELSKQLNTPVVLISASKGTGVEKVFEFLNAAPLHLPPKPPLLQLPVLQDVPKVRDWDTSPSGNCCGRLITAGIETTGAALSHALIALSANPDQRALWRSDYARHAPSAVEEILRWSTPVMSR